MMLPVYRSLNVFSICVQACMLLSLVYTCRNRDSNGEKSALRCERPQL